MGLVQVWGCLAFAALVLGCLYKAIRYATMPVHLRWELYPVAHEGGKAEYGGSYFEEVEWWTKPRHVSRLGELRTIAEEVLTLRAVRENNPRLWFPSLAFHFGLYTLFALGAAMLLGAATRAAGLDWLPFLAGGTPLLVVDAIGLALATAGALGLLARRTLHPELRRASTPADFFHLLLLLAVFAASWGSWIAVDRRLSLAASFLDGILGLRASPPVPGLFAAQIVMLGVFLAYLPWSHMTHFFGKYFTWHSVRWDDAPNMDGTVFEERVNRLLMRPIHWSAPHIGADGRKTWADVAGERTGH